MMKIKTFMCDKINEEGLKKVEKEVNSFTSSKLAFKVLKALSLALISSLYLIDL